MFMSDYYMIETEYNSFKYMHSYTLQYLKINNPWVMELWEIIVFLFLTFFISEFSAVIMRYFKNHKIVHVIWLQSIKSDKLYLLKTEKTV